MVPALGILRCVTDRRLLFILMLLLLAILALPGGTQDASAITWDEERAFTAGGTVAGTVADSEGDNLYYVWAQQGSPNNSIFFKWFDGKIWSLPEWLGYAQVYSWERPVMAVEDGVVHVVWRGAERGDTGIYYRSFNGSAWSDPVLLTPDLFLIDQGSPVISVDGRNVHVAWLDQRDGDYDVVYRLFDGKDWLPSEEISIDVTNEDQAALDMVVDEGRAHIIWTVDHKVHHRVKDAGGWGEITDVVVMESKHYPFYPSLAASDGVVYIAFSARDEASEMCINMTVNDGGGWNTWGRVNSIRHHYDPYFRLDAEKGNLVLVYMEIMETDVMFQHFNGSGWSEAEFINDSSAGDQWLPQVRLVDGVVHVTYSDMGIGKHKRGFIEDGPPLSDVKRLGSYWMDPAGTDLQWTLSDDFGIASISVEYRHSTDNETWTDWSEIMFEDGESGPEASGTFSFEPAVGDGFYELRTIGTDVWGNVEPAPAEAEARAGQDTTTPTGAFGPVEGWTSDPTVNLDLTVSDATSGVVKMRVTDRTLWDDQPWVDVAPTVEVTLFSLSSGNRTVMGQVMDAVGLVSDTFTVIVPLDVTKPLCEVKIISTDSYSTGRRTVPKSTVELMLYHWEVEEGAGVKSMRLSNDGIWDSEEWTDLADNMTWTLAPGEGSRTVHLQVVDGVGHLSVVGTDTVEVDMSDFFVHMTIPDDDDTNVALDIMIVVNFSEEMSVGDTQVAFSLTWEDDEGTVHKVVGTDTWDLGLRSYRFSPDEPLRESTTYRIFVGDGATDLTGNGLYPSVDNTFTTIGGTGNGNGDGDGDEGGISGLVIALVVIVVAMAVVIGFLMMRKGGETA